MTELKVHKTMQGEDIRISYREGIVAGDEMFESHCHTRYEIIAVFEGKVSIVIDGKKFTLKAGEIAVIPPLAYHSVFAVEQTMYKRATALFDESFIPREIAEDFKAKTLRQPLSSHELLSSALGRVREVFQDSATAVFLPLVKSLFIETLYTHTYKDTAAKKERSHPTVKAAIEYIDSHITEKLTLEVIAEHVFLSKSSVSHVFRSEMKISVKQYIINKKLAYAASLMRDGVSATEAATTVGYDNYSNFYKMYKNVFGTSPRDDSRKR